MQLYTRFNLFDGWLAACPLVRVDFERLLHRTCLHTTPLQDSLSTSFQIAIISGFFNATSHHFHVASHIVFKNLTPLSNFAQLSTFHCTTSTVCIQLLRHRLYIRLTPSCRPSFASFTSLLARRYRRRSSHSSKLIPREPSASFFFLNNIFFAFFSSNQLALDKMTPFSAALLCSDSDSMQL